MVVENANSCSAPCQQIRDPSQAGRKYTPYKRHNNSLTQAVDWYCYDIRNQCRNLGFFESSPVTET